MRERCLRWLEVFYICARQCSLSLLVCVGALTISASAYAVTRSPTPIAAPTLRPTASTQPRATPASETAQALRVVLGLTVLAILPALLVSVTSFLRIIIVLSMLRHGLGMQETPPNTALIGLALFLTLFTMSPALEQINRQAFQPFMAGSISMETAYEKEARRYVISWCAKRASKIWR